MLRQATFFIKVVLNFVKFRMNSLVFNELFCEAPKLANYYLIFNVDGFNKVGEEHQLSVQIFM